MRISTSMLYATTSDRMSKLQSDLLKTQEQISANRRILTPSDDPIAAARALEVTQKQALNTQYADNRTQATNTLSLEEVTLQTLTTLVQDLQSSVIGAGNPSYGSSERGYLATEMRGQLEELLGLANTRDASGNYIFSGFKTSSEAFSLTTTTATYHGDQGQRSIQVDATRKIRVSDTGDTVFQNSYGLGTFSVSASGGSFDVASISDTQVIDEASITGDTYNIAFAVDSVTGETTYSVFDTTLDPATPISTGTYTDPTTFTFDGIEFSVSGSRTDGDTLTVATQQPNSNQSLFSTLTDLINLLETDTGTAAGRANLNQGLAVATANLTSALDNVLTVRASVGARLNEIENLDSAGTDLDLQYSQMLSDLQDLDYTKAISILAQQKFTLEAAQSSYVQIVGLSLFNYL